MPARTIETPVGALTLQETAGAIDRIGWGDAAHADETPLLAEAARQLVEYFAGARREFDLPLRLAGTPLERAVWRAMCAIPCGATQTYGEIARQIAAAGIDAAGIDADARRVGQACGANPIAVVVPCHRVTGAGGTLVGYSGGAGVETKRWLLQHEGALLL